ncbi:MAG: GNAT family N-acetyltransferase [Bacteroidota bacterium]
MSANNKEQYRKLCTARQELPLFFQDWWLDVCCGPKQWDVALAKDKAGHVLGIMPWFLGRNKGLKMLYMPPLTPYLGPWFFYPSGLKRQHSFEKKVIAALVEQLPDCAFFFQDCTLGFDNWLPFYWKGYKQTTRYTYVFDDLSDLDAIFLGLNSSVRNKIRKAEKQLTITTVEDIEIFYQLNQKTFARQQMDAPHSLAFLRKLDKALEERAQRYIYIAKDAEGQAHAGLYLTWDRHTAYNLMLGADTQLRTSGAVQLLLWRAIQEAARRCLRFDFEGSMLPSVESLFRSFGARQQPYFRLYKGRNRLMLLLKDLFAKW